MFTSTVNVSNRLWNINLRFLDSFINKNTDNTKMYIIISISIALFFFDVSLLVLGYQKFQESEKREIANKILAYVNHEVRNQLNKLVIYNEYIIIDKFCKNLNKTIIPRLLEKIDLKFSIKIDPNLENVMIYIDKTRLEQILLNFIFNSIKFTVRGTIELCIRI